MRIVVLTLCLALSFFTSAQTFSWDKDQPSQKAITENSSLDDTGLAHFYPDYYENSPTALGEIFHQNLMTAGHQKFPLGTIVKVTRLDNGLSTTVRINDRGAYCDGCVIDLSQAAGQQINLSENGRTEVMLTIVGMSDRNPSSVSTYSQESQFTARGGDISLPSYEKEEPIFHNDSSKENAQEVIHEKQILTQNEGNDPMKCVTANPDEITIIEFPISPYTVQLGSYEKYANAERHVLGLQKKGFNNVFLLKEQRQGDSPLNRVIIAPFTSLASAEQYVDDLRQVHQMKALIFKNGLMELVED